MTQLGSFIPLRYVIEDWPEDIVPEPALLDAIGMRDLETTAATGYYLGMSGTLLLLAEIGVDLPLVPGASLVALHNGDITEIPFEFELEGLGFSLTLTDLEAALRFQSDLLRRMRDDGGTFVEDTDPATGQLLPVEISLSGAQLSVDSEGAFTFGFDANAPALSITPFMVGETGIIVEANDITPIMSEAAADALSDTIPAHWRGVFMDQLAIHLPDEMAGILPGDVLLEDFFIGGGGFCGKVTGEWGVTVTETNGQYALGGPSVGTLFGFEFGLERIALEFLQNALVASEIKGVLVLEFFDSPLAVDIGIAANGDVTVTLSPEQVDVNTITQQPDGLVTLRKDGLLELNLASFSLMKEQDTVGVTLGGSIKPLFRSNASPPMNWPEVGVQGLTIRSDGTVAVDGGWIDLSAIQPLNFYGFTLDLQQIGFGKEEGDGRWVGFSGGINLVAGLPLGASVEGLKILWFDDGSTDLALSGIGISFSIPEALEFAGSVAFLDGPAKGFKGSTYLNLLPLSASFDAQIIVAKLDNVSSLYVYLAGDLPVGIPLLQTGQALFGIAGLFGHNMAPGKAPDDDWYVDWYKSNPEGVTGVDKWTPSAGDFAFGAGLTLGTLPDGYPFAAKVLFVILLPGPILMLEGKAQFLKKRSDLAAGDPPFQALAVLDVPAGYFLFNVEAEYILPGQGRTEGMVIDIGAGAEAYFSFSDLTAWHLYLGQKAEEKRLRAEILRLFAADSYFMLESDSVAMGAFVGYDEEWKFGPVRVMLASWIEGHAVVSWMPAQFWGELALQGGVEVRACGVTIGLSAGADMELHTPTPYYLGASVYVSVKLPWPIKKWDTRLELVWQEHAEPPWPVPLNSIAIEHLKVTEKWTLDKYPTLDEGDPGYLTGESGSAPSYAQSPIVPLDARVAINFARPVDDISLIGDNPDPNPADDIIDDYKYRYNLSGVSIEKSTAPDGEGWTPLNGDEVFGQWQLNGNGERENTTLLMWSLTPLEYMREMMDQLGYVTGLMGLIEDYPCGDEPEETTVCVDFEGFEAGSRMPPVFAVDGVVFVSPFELEIINSIDSDIPGITQALRIDPHQDNPKTIYPPEPVAEISIDVNLHTENYPITFTAYNRGSVVDSFTLYPEDPPADVTVTLTAADEGIDQVTWGGVSHHIMRICYLTYEAKALRERLVAIDEHLSGSTVEHWAGEGVVLQPNTFYRVTVNTEVVRTNPDGSESQQAFSEYAYFRTENPPGCFNPDALSTTFNPDQASEHYPTGGPLVDLSPYVYRTIPTAGHPHHYCGYDIGLEFNESYVEQMYLMVNSPLTIHLYDNNDQPVLDADGNPVVLLNTWGDNPTTEFTVGEMFYDALAEAGDCVDVSVDTLPPDQALFGGLPAGASMRPSTAYVAKLMSGSYEVYRFAFTTSRFATFTDHIKSFSGVVWEHLANSGVDELLSDAEFTGLRQQVESLGAGIVNDGGATYNQMVSDFFSLGYRVLPETIDITLLNDEGHNYGLLLESPEPLDWDRIDLAFAFGEEGDASLKVRDCAVVVNADHTRAFIFRLAKDGILHEMNAGEYELRLTYHLDQAGVQPVLKYQGASNAEQVTLAFNLEKR